MPDGAEWWRACWKLGGGILGVIVVFAAAAEAVGEVIAIGAVEEGDEVIARAGGAAGDLLGEWLLPFECRIPGAIVVPSSDGSVRRSALGRSLNLRRGFFGLDIDGTPGGGQCWLSRPTMLAMA
ncbi:MAG: hypothetical protein IPG05_16125 [Gemmatimonadetes bacterium]|nr:hypothetical protein [Gemmatimonadota bacterium]